MAGQIIGDLLAYVIDGDGEVATSERKWIIDNRSLLGAIFGRCATESEVGSTV